MLETSLPRDATAEELLAYLSDLENRPDEEIVPYREYNVEGKLYYFTPGGFSLPQGPGDRRAGGFFYGYLSEEA